MTLLPARSLGSPNPSAPAAVSFLAGFLTFPLAIRPSPFKECHSPDAHPKKAFVQDVIPLQPLDPPFPFPFSIYIPFLLRNPRPRKVGQRHRAHIGHPDPIALTRITVLRSLRRPGLFLTRHCLLQPAASRQST